MGLGIGFLPYLWLLKDEVESVTIVEFNQDVIAPYLYTVYEGKDIIDFISSIDADSKKFAKKVNRYFKTRNDVIRTEDELLSIIHGKNVFREILAQ